MPWIAWGEPINLVVKHESIEGETGEVKYDAAARFLRSPRGPLANIDIANLDALLDGDSDIVLADEHDLIRTVWLNGAGYQLRLQANSEGRLASCAIDLPDTASITSAMSSVRTVLNQFVWETSYTAKIPLEYDFLFVRRSDLREFMIGFTPSMPASRPVISPDLHVHRDLRPFISLFVEGLRSTSPFYRFLCFFKVCQRINHPVRAQFQKMARGTGLSAMTLNGEFPSDPIQKFAPEMVGVRYTVAIQKYQFAYRNAIAHFDPKDKLEPFDVSVEAKVRTAAALMAWAAHDLISQVVEGVKHMLASGVSEDSIRFG